MRTLYGVTDLERLIYGDTSSYKSYRQKKIRQVLCSLGEGVGKGNRYEWDEVDIGTLFRMVKARLFG